MAFIKPDDNMKAMKRKNYFKRKSYLKNVRKKILQRDVLEIQKSHPKFLFLHCIRLGMRKVLSADSFSKQAEVEVPVESFHLVLEENFTTVNNAVVHFHAYAPSVFSYIRCMAGINADDFLETVAPADEETFYLEFLSNSKSGQNFFLTNNKQLMLKTVTKKEAKFFQSILPEYIGHFLKFPHSLLVKFLGLYSIKVKLLQKPVYFVVMMSIFYPDERIAQRFDIKACQIGRFTKPANDDNDMFIVFKEKNWSDKKLQLGPQRNWFLKQVKFDTEFLKKIGVLDYSLLVGVQSLHLDEVKRNKDLASVISRARKSYVKKLSITSVQSHSSSSTHAPSAGTIPEAENEIFLPGMVGGQSSNPVCTKKTVVEADTGEKQTVCELARATAAAIVSSEHTVPRTESPNAPTEKLPLSNHVGSRSPDLFCRRNVILSEDEATSQNRRLLPDSKNELHVIDGSEERYFVGIIDFFTRYTLKKKLENAYKRVIYPPLSFSTVPPPVFAERFNKFWEEHTG